MGAAIKITSGPALERVGDLAAILTNLEDGDVLFIDEIHRMNRTIEEVLYPAMEDFALDIVIGKGPTARTLRLDLKRFTLIGATTKMSMLSAPFRDRFGSVYHLDFYGVDEMMAIVKRSATLLGIPLGDEESRVIASRSRRTPRIANRLLKRVRDYAQVRGNGTLNPSIVDEALTRLEIDPRGLDDMDRRTLRAMIEKIQRWPRRTHDARRIHGRGCRNSRRSDRAVPSPRRIDRSHAARSRGHCARIRAPGNNSAKESNTFDLEPSQGAGRTHRFAPTKEGGRTPPLQLLTTHYSLLTSHDSTLHFSPRMAHPSADLDVFCDYQLNANVAFRGVRTYGVLCNRIFMMISVIILAATIFYLLTADWSLVLNIGIFQLTPDVSF